MVTLNVGSLNGKVALVTGGSRGIGRAISSALATAGIAVSINYRERVQDAEAAVAEIEKLGGKAISVKGDVSRGENVAAIVAHTRAKLGEIDILVNNAGIGPVIDVGNLTEAQFDESLAVNLKSAFLCTQAVLPGMRARGWGRVISVSSAAARGPGMVGVHYSASKAGLEGLTRAYASRVAGEGVTVNAVSPAAIDTDMTAPLKAGNGVARLPMGRLGDPCEVADVVVMLVNNGFVTGQTIAVNGGLSFI
ncbi:SDR family NAD(P)-dependent oxidoreductase [Paraburkholderia caffeinilytica]|uniref:SDR family NAD(P)-dependent oxidoreductase n=1 Tax=Paraburkholderia caffeinilytica TaxID=1761016 RepID=UPI0038BD87A9